MRKKIGILTFHNVPNYGAVLQAFALKTYLHNCVDSDVEIIDFQCSGNSDDFIPDTYFNAICNSNNKIKKIIKTLLVKCFAEKQYKTKYTKFNNFVKHQLSIAPYTTDIYKNYNYIFCGSDQIWNGDITNGYQLPYFGADRNNDATAIVASYAASCGDINDFDETKKAELYELVRKMDYVGVREKSLANDLNRQNIKARNTIDPTLLLDKNEYIRALDLKVCVKKNYILEYALGKSDDLDSVAAKISREKNIPIIKICGYVNMIHEKGIFDAGPKDFLELLASAEYVVTNSFHGAAFSIIFEKNFNIVLPNVRKSRIVDFLDIFSLNNRICKNSNDAIFESIDYNLVKNILKEYVDDSKKYIDMIVHAENVENE